MEPGLYPNISHKEYHALERVSNSYLGRLDKCPASAKLPSEETAALIFGRAFHCYTLEGQEAFKKEFAVAPQCDRRTKAGKAVFEDFETLHPNHTILTQADLETIEGMYNAVAFHPFASKLLTEGRSEISVLWTDEETGLDCKCRPDRIPDGDHGVIVDVKTVRDASEYGFQKSVVNYGYARQAGMYTEGYNSVCSGKVDAFVFICVEKEPPYRTEVYVLDDDFVEWGRNEFHRLLNIEKECRQKEFYPHYRNAGAGQIMMPAYLYGGRL